MTKQDEIREGMAEKAHLIWQRWMAYMLTHFRDEYIEKWKEQANTPYSNLSEQDKESDRAIADQYFEYLHSQGVAIKVDRDMEFLDDIGIYPKSVVGGENDYEERSPYQNGWNAAVLEITKQWAKEAKDFKAVEPLIKEE